MIGIFHNINRMTIKKPNGYNSFNYAQAEHSPAIAEQQNLPNIIMIMGEAYSDLSINDHLDFSNYIDPMEEYKKIKLGNSKDRKNGHNTKTSIIFLYTSEEEETNHILNKVSIYDEFWGQNPLFFFSDEETERMKSLARERISYVKEAFKTKDNSILLKIGLPLKEKGKFEHIWFELLEIKGSKFKAKLTQEPYDIPNMHTGNEAWYTIDDITDWIIYTKEVASTQVMPIF